jgi:hypothetical protein
MNADTWTTETLSRLAAVRAMCPELRFGQLLATVGELAQDVTGHSLWDVDDSDFGAALEKFAADLGRRGAVNVSPIVTTSLEIQPTPR